MGRKLSCKHEIDSLREQLEFAQREALRQTALARTHRGDREMKVTATFLFMPFTLQLQIVEMGNKYSSNSFIDFFAENINSPINRPVVMFI